MLVSRYKIEVKEEPQFAGETLEERKARIFATKPGLTLMYVVFHTASTCTQSWYLSFLRTRFLSNIVPFTCLLCSREGIDH